MAIQQDSQKARTTRTSEQFIMSPTSNPTMGTLRRSHSASPATFERPTALRPALASGVSFHLHTLSYMPSRLDASSGVLPARVDPGRMDSLSGCGHDECYPVLAEGAKRRCCGRRCD